MDLFLINGQDGISLPEMIDWDIKLSDSDFSEEVGVNSILGLGYELPSLDIDEEPNPLWTQSYSGNSNSSFELDFLGEGASALMVNPCSVMPFVSTHRRVLKEEKNSDSEEDTLEEQNDKTDNVTEENLIDVKVEVVEENDQNDGAEVKVNIEELSEQSVTFEPPLTSQEIVTMPLEFISVSMENKVIEVTPSKKVLSQKRQVAPNSSDPIKVYPKPAYSYSCLIAMALKNSLTGSLPVSEIYSFMCHHFPYFKTAPNGWKNSVRHNLSLNKCFEKIEKPPGSGASGSQRKGCLWAMNPAKITKMDDEVAKWSRKDPSAIKKAMVFPDNLELLERGDLKDCSAFKGDETAFNEDEVEEDTEAKEEEDEVEEEFGEVEDERISPIDDEDSEDEISRVPPSLQPFEPKLAHLTRTNILTKKNTSRTSLGLDFTNENNIEVDDVMYDVEVSDTRTLFGLDDSTPIYAVDPMDENMLIELPLVKRPRVQGSYFYQPVLNMKRHNLNGFRSIKIQSP